MKSIMSDDSDYQRTVRYSTVESYARCSEKHAKSFFPHTSTIRYRTVRYRMVRTTRTIRTDRKGTCRAVDSFAEQRGSDGRFQRAVLDRAKPLTVVL